MGETILIGWEQKIERIQLIGYAYRISQDCNTDGDCAGSLDKVKARNVVLIKQMKLSE